ncbi:cystatin-B-like [Chelonoidis abingdonii]|uniref:cystatin-B-like n=1 Tax=Chelonoidis abingdonii TaxID=106734 RepID=UPI0013F2717A|nr:cystatin-B-like [Chelonoidis abingdonii]
MSSEDGWSKVLPVTLEIADEVKLELEKKVGKTYPVFKAITYRYLERIADASHKLFKVSVSDSTDECVHLYVVIVFTAPPGNPILRNYQLNKTKDDPLEPF